MNQILDLFQELDKQVTSIQPNITEIIKIANFSCDKDDTNALMAECSLITSKIGNYSVLRDTIYSVFKKIKFERVRKDGGSASSEDTQIEETKEQSEDDEMIEQTKRYESISLKPQYQRSSEKSKLDTLPSAEGYAMIPAVEYQYQIMRELYSLQNTDNRYVDYSGLYPRINYLQGSSPNEIRYWYNFGAINSIYLQAPTFAEINLLPQWIKDGVKDCYFNNPTITVKDILMLKFLSAGPDFYQDERYNAYHFIQLGKSDSFSISTSEIKKEFFRFNEKDIHYRRAIGLKVICQGMEAAFKRGFRTYGGKTRYSSVMIAHTKMTPPAAARFLQAKIKMIDTGNLKSSPQALERFCQLRKHDKGTCLICSPQKEKDLISLSSDDD